MTISKVMGATTYSTVMNVADTDIANVMGVAQGGGGGATLLDGFEAVPLTSMITWYKNEDVGTFTVTRSTSHPTQGTYSWNLNGAVSNLLAWNLDSYDPVGISFDVNLTGFTDVLLDVYVNSAFADSELRMYVVDSDFNTAEAAVSFDSTGAFTITADISAFTAKGTCAVAIAAQKSTPSVASGTADVYIDNLRAI